MWFIFDGWQSYHMRCVSAISLTYHNVFYGGFKKMRIFFTSIGFIFYATISVSVEIWVQLLIDGFQKFMCVIFVLNIFLYFHRNLNHIAAWNEKKRSLMIESILFLRVRIKSFDYDVFFLEIRQKVVLIREYFIVDKLFIEQLKFTFL